jgi:hypothetical protein
MGIEEIFSIFLERVTKNSYYIQSLLSSSNMDINRTVNELESRNKFMELFFVTLYSKFVNEVGILEQKPNSR